MTPEAAGAFAPPSSPVTQAGLRPAPVVLRALAAALDWSACVVVFYGGIYLLIRTGGPVRLQWLAPGAMMALKPVTEAFGGRSLGKLLFGLRVVDDLRRPIGPMAAITRNLDWCFGPVLATFLGSLLLHGGILAGPGALMLGALALVGLVAWVISGLVARDGRALHDRLAGSRCVRGWTLAAVRTGPHRRRRSRDPA